MNLTGATMSSQSRELETSSIADYDATTTPPPVGGGSQTGAQESPSMSDVELEYNIVPPDKGKGKAVPDNTVQGGVGCIYAHYKVNPNIFQFYFDFMNIFHHPPMHSLFRNIYEFYFIFYYFISSFIIYNYHFYLRRYFLF